MNTCQEENFKAEKGNAFFSALKSTEFTTINSGLSV